MTDSTTQAPAPAATFAEFTFADGGDVQVNSTEAGVTIYQGSAGTQGRGAALLTPDEAEQLAAALVSHAKQVRDAAKPAAAPAEDEAS